MPLFTQSTNKQVIRIIIPLAVLLMVLFYNYIDPSKHQWIPKCPWWLLTGTYCPSCGIQRAISLLTKGDLIGAFLKNPFLIISIPYAFLAVLGKFYNINNVFDKLNSFLYSRKVLIAYTILFFIWWAIRIIFSI